MEEGSAEALGAEVYSGRRSQGGRRVGCGEAVEHREETQARLWLLGLLNSSDSGTGSASQQATFTNGRY